MAIKYSSHAGDLAWLLSFCLRTESGCLEYGRCKSEHGYGVINYRRRAWRTHRLSWYLHYGPIPSGLYVLHTCDNPPCVESAHLYLGTQGDNMRDRKLRNRANASRKLSGDQEKQITLRYEHRYWEPKTPGNSGPELCHEYGISPATLYGIIRRHGRTSG